MIQLQEKGVEIPPLEEATFIIREYYSSSKNSVGIATILVTIGVRIVETQFQVVDLKVSYNPSLARPWLHDMDVVPSIVYGRLKFKYQDEVHTIIGDPESYALCNVVDFKEFIMTYPRYKIVSLEISAPMVSANK